MDVGVGDGEGGRLGSGVEGGGVGGVGEGGGGATRVRGYGDGSVTLHT